MTVFAELHFNICKKRG